MKLLKTINPENVSEEEVNKYSIREAARALVIDNQGHIAILHVSKAGYYKIPGGGIEGEENKEVALRRECMEEIGCDVDILGEVGMILEYRKFSSEKQVSYCYIAKLKGKKGKPSFTDEESNNSFEELWLPYNEAIMLFHENKTTDFEGSKYIVERDKTFLKEAKNTYPNLFNI
ncbi:MAG: NUDIX domain-containing protein [Patescibacteria group bacterium]